VCDSEWVCSCKRVVTCGSWTFCVWYVLVFYASVLMTICMSCTYLTWGVLVLCSGFGCWWCGIRVQPTLGYHITNRQSRYITPARLKSAQYNLHNNVTSSSKLLKMDVLTSETCWAVNWHNKASVIKLVYLYSNTWSCTIEIRAETHVGLCLKYPLFLSYFNDIY